MQRKYDFKNGTVMDAEQVDAEFNQLIGGINTLESADAAIKAAAQMTKLTNDTGGVKLSTKTTADDILQIILAAGKGMHTFYAVGGSKNLPPTNISIRGIAHFTDSGIGWVYATDYRNNIFTNYYDTNSWKGWEQLLKSGANAVATSLNGMTLPGTYWVNASTTDAPTTHFGILKTDNTDKDSLYLAQTFIDMQWGDHYERFRYSGVWQPWKKVVYAENDQEALWDGGANDGWYMMDNQTVTPFKKLSQCRNGWVLVWSDYDTSPAQTNNFDFSYSYIPKGTLFKDGSQHLFTVPNFLSATTSGVIVKKLMLYDNKIVGHADNANSATQTNDVVLRLVLEW
jgi:hypothetical protein